MTRQVTSHQVSEETIDIQGTDQHGSDENTTPLEREGSDTDMQPPDLYLFVWQSFSVRIEYRNILHSMLQYQSTLT